MEDPKWISLIGILAGTLTTIAFLPQVIHSVKTKDTKGISLHMYLIFTAGIFLWLIYGLFRQDVAIIFANSLTIVLALIILYYKFRNG